MGVACMLLEVIADTLEDAVTAERCGADRIELITAVREGGLTPSFGLIEAVVSAVSIPVHVMVRPHSRSFRYDRRELETMARDIRLIRRSGAAGIVVGALREDGTVDEEALRRLFDEAEGLSVTFHRAFDEAVDQFAALEELGGFPEVKRILTSGGKPNVLDARERIKTLVERSEGTGLTILAGSGLRFDGLADFVTGTGVREVHFGSWVRRNGNMLAPIDPMRLEAVRDVLRGL